MENTCVTQTQHLFRYNRPRGAKDQPERVDIVVPRQGYDVLILHAQVQRDNFETLKWIKNSKNNLFV